MSLSQLVALVALALPLAVQAEENCADKIAVDSVFQVANTGNNKSESPFVYVLKVRNKMGSAVRFTLVLGVFPQDVKLYWPQTTNTLNGAGKELKFAEGTSQNVNSGTVPVVFTAPTVAAKPYVWVKDCVVK